MTIFDHAKHSLNRGSFDSLSENDKKTWSSFMIQKICSMDVDNIRNINSFLNPFLFDMDDETVHEVIGQITPHKSYYDIRYRSKKGKKGKQPDKLLDAVQDFYKCDRKMAMSYIKIMDKQSLIEICERMGLEPSTIKKITK